ncbi:NYN domain-containing protein [Aurantimonas sp. A2-1-M11]|uniref:NYN domain-containing protein n=1 Tax=Aurantimonas sp. A2-1-M11 TaxID=3113712 RepID=UPI002F94EC3D
MSNTRPDRTARLAVLIDADNASSRIADGLFEEIAKIGEASVRRIYGDFSSSRSKGWADVLSRHAIIPQQQFAYTTGKNASDITLVIDAMDLLHSGRFDGFCLVSSDSDFTRLAARIREQGVDVYGFGEQKTPESFRQACRRFIYTENLLPQRITAEKEDGKPTSAPLAKPQEAADLLKRVIEQMDTEDGWVNLGSFGKQLLNLSSDFDPRTYGFKKLSDLVRSTDLFEVDDPEGGSVDIRLKPVAKPAPRRRATASRASGGGAERTRSGPKSDWT